MPINDAIKTVAADIKSSKKFKEFISVLDGKTRERMNSGHFDIHLEFEAAIHYVATLFDGEEYDTLRGGIERWRVEVNDYFILVIELQRERLSWKVSVEDFD